MVRGFSLFQAIVSTVLLSLSTSAFLPRPFVSTKTTTTTSTTQAHVFKRVREEKTLLLPTTDDTTTTTTTNGPVFPDQSGSGRVVSTTPPTPTTTTSRWLERVWNFESSHETNENNNEWIVPDYNLSPQQLLLPLLAVLMGVGLGGAVAHFSLTLDDLRHTAQLLVCDPQGTLSNIMMETTTMVQNMDRNNGLFLFGILYFVAEVLAIPATPLTLSAGYCFGLLPGTAVVLVAGTCAATVAFFVGKTLLRDWLQKDILPNHAKFQKLDAAIGQQGFKLLFLVRLSPIFPFALSNYLYGASSIRFVDFFWGTLLGFGPGTLGYVYTGLVGKELLSGNAASQPWYVYVVGMAALAGCLKLVTDVASEIVEAIDDDDT